MTLETATLVAPLLHAVLYVPGGEPLVIPDPCISCGLARDDAGRTCSECRRIARQKQQQARIASGESLAIRKRPCGCGGSGPHRIDCRKGLRASPAGPAPRSSTAPVPPPER